MDLSPEGKKAMAYWGVIEPAAAARMPTAELWSALRAAAAELGLPSPGVTLRGVNEVCAAANAIHRAERDFARLEDGMSLGDRYVAQTPWSRSLAEQNALPTYHVRFLHTFSGPEGEQSEWRTSVITGQLPDTAGELHDLVSEDAENLADKYGVDHVGYSSVQILGV